MANKYKYWFVVQGYYGATHGWEDVSMLDTYHEAKMMRRDYDDNEPQYPHRIVTRREYGPDRQTVRSQAQNASKARDMSVAP